MRRTRWWSTQEHCKTFKTSVGRMHRKIGRQLDRLPEQAKAKAQDLLHRVSRVLAQKAKDKNKLSALQGKC